MVATDSYRLSIKKIKASNKEHTSIIVPRRAIEDLVKIIPDKGSIKISFSDNQISFKSEGMVFVSRLIGGQYPNFQQLFPKEFKSEIEINREEMLQSTKRMALLSPSTPIVLKAKDNKLTLASKSADVGSGEEEILLKNKTKEIEIAFNSKYLIEGLSAFDDDEIKIQLTDSFQPGLIRGGKSEGFQYLIMPVRLN